MTIPRSEYPRPQFVRSDWLCLNGEWEFEIDNGDSGQARGLLTNPLSDKITVPFCPESFLSGLTHTDFMLAVWYRKTVQVPDDWKGRHVQIHFGAVDYDATVWVNGEEVARHRGGFTPFSALLRNVTGGDTFTVVVRARDDWHSPKARGKQSQQYAPHGCVYTRTTGIWQTVWIEPVPETALRPPPYHPGCGKRHVSFGAADHAEQARLDASRDLQRRRRRDRDGFRPGASRPVAAPDALHSRRQAAAVVAVRSAFV